MDQFESKLVIFQLNYTKYVRFGIVNPLALKLPKKPTPLSSNSSSEIINGSGIIIYDPNSTFSKSDNSYSIFGN